VTERPSLVDRLERPWVAVGLCVAVYLPFVFLGYGTDIDVGNVLAAGRRWLDDGEYSVSRVPGAAVHEVSTAFLDKVGGSVLVNLASVLFAGLALWGLQELLRREGSRISGLAVLVLATNPWFWITATSLGDFTWALGLLMAGAVAARRDHRIFAGVLFALATGCRLSTMFLVVGWLIAEQIGDRSTRVPLRSTFVTGGVALALGALCFVPSWLSSDRTLDFLDSASDFAGLRVHLGRWAIKNVAFFGVLAGAVLAFGLPRLRRAWPAWRSSVAFRFALLALVVTELVYFRFPFKPVHLIPAAMATALLIGHFGTAARRWIGVLIAAQLIGGLVTTTIASPDVTDRATGGQIELGITQGPLLNDIRCRLDDRDEGPYEEGSPESIQRSARNASCQLETWRATP
jgi:Glycosyltransferase family 87